MGWLIGDRLRERREVAELTGGMVAEYEGISSSYVSQLESGTNRPNWDLLARLAKRYRTSADYILGLTDIPDPYPTIRLTKRERELLKLMSGLSEEAQMQLLEVGKTIHRLDADQRESLANGVYSVLEEEFGIDAAQRLISRIRARRSGSLPD